MAVFQSIGSMVAAASGVRAQNDGESDEAYKAVIVKFVAGNPTLAHEMRTGVAYADMSTDQKRQCVVEHVKAIQTAKAGL